MVKQSTLIQVMLLHQTVGKPSPIAKMTQSTDTFVGQNASRNQYI